MNEFIYSIKEIFCDGGVLETNNVSKYYIAPYQRGYKWSSESRYDQVPQMLIDIYEAYKRKTPEYYLQYITLMKRNINDALVFEIIDGQQRLTTLSILFYCISYKGYGENIALDKMAYSRYESKNIFSDVMNDIQSVLDGVRQVKHTDTQDKYYMETSALCIISFLETLNNNNELQNYLEYFEQNVMLIVNIESEFVKPENVFSNLNDNKVALTNAELIKGLLLTIGVDYKNHNNQRKHYKEILDQRAIMGRMWDEIFAWIEQPKVCRYFFGDETKGMEHLLSLIKLSSPKIKDECLSTFLNNIETVKFKSNFLLFDCFNEAISTNTDARNIITELKHIYRTLHDIYNNMDDTLLYNMLGYVFFSKKPMSIEERKSILKQLLLKSKLEKINFLKSQIRYRIPSMRDLKNTALKNDSEPYQELKYTSTNDKLTNLLLSFSVFPEDNNQVYRFNFYQYDTQNWSFEHIFPQHPKNKVKIAPEAKEIVKKIAEKFYSELTNKESEEQKENKRSDLKEILCKIENGDYILINDEVFDFLYKATFDVDSVGNMALLSGGANSALSNNPFVAKRPILSRKIKEGYFVPRHTTDVFNKILNVSDKPFNIELTTWDEKDIEAHICWMERRNAEILKMMEEGK